MPSAQPVALVSDQDRALASPDRVIYLQAHESRPTKVNMPYRVLAFEEDTNTRFSSVESVLTHEMPLHVHTTHDESMYILNGVMDMYICGKVYRCSPGSYMYLPRGLPHCPRPVTDTVATVTIQAPGDFGHMMEGMIEVGHRLGKIADLSHPEVIAAAASYGWILLDPDFWAKWDAGEWKGGDEVYFPTNADSSDLADLYTVESLSHSSRRPEGS
jgi:mannose-6-phosphate isomerase-like protein (cupin superfamily)